MVDVFNVVGARLILAGVEVIMLVTMNVMVVVINVWGLAVLSGDLQMSIVEVEGEFGWVMFFVDELLDLKLGVCVMFFCNDVLGDVCWVNGMMGMVVKIGDIVMVEVDGEDYEVGFVTWEWFCYEYDLIMK